MAAGSKWLHTGGYDTPSLLARILSLSANSCVSLLRLTL